MRYAIKRSPVILLAFISFSLLADDIVNVLSLGALGDGVHDDGPAIQRAFDQAVAGLEGDNQHRSFSVYIPSGTYRIEKSLRLERQHRSLSITGAGIYGTGGVDHPPTRILWCGSEGGVMLDAASVKGLRIKDIFFDGGMKAGKLVRVNSNKKFVSAQWFIERVALVNAKEGFVCGDESDVCNSDMTFYDLFMKNLDVGFHTYDEQALNYHFIRPQIGKCGIGMYFEKGGSVYASMVSGWGTGTVVKIGHGGLNAGTFNFPSMRMESYKVDGKRQVILETEGGNINVKFDSLLTTCLSLWGKDADFDTPNFILGPGTQVTVDSSIISGNVASIRGGAERKTMLQFNGCTFEASSDPTDIQHDANSGVSIRNCIYYPKGGNAIFISSVADFGKNEAGDR